MNKTFLTLSAAVLALTGTAAIAQHRGGENLDTDGDGRITLAEMQATSAARFARMDANGDGVLNADDRAAVGAEMFAQADTDGNGELTAAEMKAAHEARKANRPERGDRADRRGRRGGDRSARMAEHFAKADTDQSGGLSQAELAAMHEARGERGEARKLVEDAWRANARHPAAPELAARLASQDGDRAATRRWLERTLRVAPHWKSARARLEALTP